MEESKKREVKKIDLKTGRFSTKDHNYTILDSFPISRYRAFRKLQPRLIFGLDAHSLFKNCERGFNYCNSTKPEPANAAIIFHNIMNGIKDVDDDSREDAALLICALIIVRDNEDIGSYDEKLSIEKIRDWEKEGFSIDDFFQLALISIPNFKKVFEQYTALQATE